ncbi:MAG: hypothetical protein NTX49_07775 [Chlamydiae bacterium]|nr:hypothetical protein [Chlamydiota bacterium]
MGVSSQAHHEKVKMTIECTLDERIYIKMLAAKAHLNLSEFLLSYVRSDFPKKKKPNKKTLEAMKEGRKGKGIACESLEDFWDKMGVCPDA